jgi:hypothetical protein
VYVNMANATWDGRMRTCLIATVSPVVRSMALYTFPKLPAVFLSVDVSNRMCVRRTAQLLHNLVVLRHGRRC